MKKILVIAGSNSKKSINKALATYASGLISNSTPIVLDLNDFEMPIYSPERQEEHGILPEAKSFLKSIEECDGIILSLAEHNGSFATAFKNIIDWASRANPKLWSEKPMLLMSTSPGGRGGATVLAAAENYYPHMGAKVVATFSMPKFYDNFKEAEGIVEPGLKAQLSKAIAQFEASI